jgi:hypothetical protein
MRNGEIPQTYLPAWTKLKCHQGVAPPRFPDEGAFADACRWKLSLRPCPVRSGGQSGARCHLPLHGLPSSFGNSFSRRRSVDAWRLPSLAGGAEVLCQGWRKRKAARANVLWQLRQPHLFGCAGSRAEDRLAQTRDGATARRAHSNASILAPVLAAVASAAREDR